MRLRDGDKNLLFSKTMNLFSWMSCSKKIKDKRVKGTNKNRNKYLSGITKTKHYNS